MGAQPSTEADADGDEEDIFPTIKGTHSSFLVSAADKGSGARAGSECLAQWQTKCEGY